MPHNHRSLDRPEQRRHPALDRLRENIPFVFDYVLVDIA